MVHLPAEVNMADRHSELLLGGGGNGASAIDFGRVVIEVRVEIRDFGHGDQGWGDGRPVQESRLGEPRKADAAA